MRFFFLQFARIRGDHAPQFDAVPEIESALRSAGSDDLASRWGVELEHDAAAAIFPKLCAKYGPKRDVTEFILGQVLKTMAMKTDESRMLDWANKKLQAPKKH